MINALLSVPTGYQTESALIIAPYFDPWFGRQVAERLQPQRLRFVVDDGARYEDIEALEQEVRDAGVRDLRILVAQANSLMHMKAYYFQFRNQDGIVDQRHLQFGSANATKAGYSDSGNAELIAATRLLPSEHADIINYFDSVLEAADTGGGRIQGIACSPGQGTPGLFLPSFYLSDADAPAGFDGWLQRGRLVAKYRDAQKFLSVTIRLKKAVPPGEVAQVFAEHGMGNVAEKYEVGHRYVAETGDLEDKSANPLWRSKYCVWTHFGYWVSEECYKQRKGEFVAGAKAKREAAINELLANYSDKTWKDSRRSQFIMRLQTIWSALEELGPPSDYLEGDEQLDIAFYCERFDKKVAEDARLAREPKFKERYVNGYDFPPVPKFRPDTDPWNAFLESWADTIALEADQSKKNSQLVKTLEYVLGDVERLRDLSSSEIVNWLRATWRNEIKPGAIVLAKYEDGYFYPATIKRTEAERHLITWLQDGVAARVRLNEVCFVSDGVENYFLDYDPYWEKLDARAAKYADSA
ncbi:hypothetical protein [Microvirga sp. Mcv34]|uniref:hypothetical protein n=1 Tax=Microvirga sp. Mcv34 TaxID=2926016 RepID=UPI0021C5E13E|nr:hypothetical protein [Microvirga sp. Mcv34]